MVTRRTFVASIVAVGLLAGCSELAAPPPEAADDDPRSVRATDPAAAEAGIDEAEPSVAADPDGTAPAAAGGADDSETADELPPDRPRVHPEQFVSRWLDHHLPRASDDEWRVTEAGRYEWDLAGIARIIEPDPAIRTELDQTVRELYALPADERPIDAGYLVVEFEGDFVGTIVHTTAPYDGEVVRLFELAGSVMGFVDSVHSAHIEDVMTVDGVHVFHVATGAGGIEARIWRHGPRTVFFTGPYGVGMEEIARATIEFNT